MPKAPATPVSMRTQNDAVRAEPYAQPRNQAPGVVQGQGTSAGWTSNVRHGTTICKTNARKKYSLSELDLHGLPFVKSSARKNIKGRIRPVPMYLYDEREVERRAWEKHGGPEGIQEMLAKRHQRRTTGNAQSGGQVYVAIGGWLCNPAMWAEALGVDV